MKAAIYCRLSEEDRNKLHETDESCSISNQKAMLQQYARQQGWEIYDIYSDDDRTGTDRNRPEFNRLLEDARLRRFHIVLCKTQSRFTRELELVEKYIHGLFPLWGIRFVSIVDCADTDDKGNKKSRQINGLINEWYLEDMSENIRSVLKSRRELGFHTGSFALYGYRKDPDRKGHLLVDEEAASVVREIFLLFSRGMGKTAIARTLNSRGIPNPTEYKRLRGLSYRQPGENSTLWTYSSVSRILTNESYLGNLVQGRYGSVSYKTKQNRPRPRSEWCIVNGTHEPVIDRELWDQVQALILEKNRPFRAGTIGLFSGKARCAGCGSPLRSTVSRGIRYLQCPRRRLWKNACEGSFISVDRLEELVRSQLEQLTEEYLDREKLRNSIDPGGLRSEKESLLARVALCRKKADEYSGGIRELYVDRGKGILSEDDFRTMAAEFSRERDRLYQESASCRIRLAHLESQLASGDPAASVLDGYVRPERLDRKTVDTMIDYISVGKRMPGTRSVPINIHWNF